MSTTWRRSGTNPHIRQSFANPCAASPAAFTSPTSTCIPGQNACRDENTGHDTFPENMFTSGNL